ncbi:MAG: amidohydrolase [Chloroflexota bacterium]|nr:amidohydrolase [Chloroflexota bacterium]
MSSSRPPVVDFHLHLNRLDASMRPSWVSYMGQKMGDRFGDVLESMMNRPAMEAFLDENGVDYAVCLADMSLLTTGLTPNEWVAEVCAGSPRLLPFGNINPALTTRPADELERLVSELRIKGLKMYPSYQHFYPNDRSLYPLYAKAEERGLPVVFHTGLSMFEGSRVRYAQPIYLDDLAVDFPSLTIVMAHAGRTAWFDEAWMLSRMHRHVFMEVSGLPPKKLLDYWPDLERNADKILFGSDWEDVPSIKGNVEAIRALPIGEDAKQKILGANAARILGLTSSTD